MKNDTLQQYEMLEKCTDEELIKKIREGEESAEDVLYNRYKSIVRSCSRTYFLIGADREDVIQEGMIGLYKAVCDYGFDRQVTFRSFAEICITRQIITAITRATRKKHGPLNNYISLNRPAYEESDEGERTLLEIIRPLGENDPEEQVISREKYEDFSQRVNDSLSPLEKEVLSYYIKGIPYQQIAVIMNRSTKSIDNAIQRIKKKLETIIKSQV